MFKKKVKVQPSERFPRIAFSDIQKATNNFDGSLNLGRGYLADVYKAPVSDGETRVLAAIKRLNTSTMDGAPESWPELDTLATFRHPNLASLIGYCSFVEDAHSSYRCRKEIVLVYEYFPHGSLKYHLHVRRTSLSWITRLNICIGVARALDYLHTRTGTKTDTAPMHGHLMSSNIFLTESWTAKVSDFGLAKYGPSNSCPVGGRISGAAGCDAYSLVSFGHLSKKSDVYSFGVVLLEVLCRKRVVDGNADRALLSWVRDSFKQGRRLEDIVDPDIKNQVSAKSLKDFYEIAERCLCERPEERPDMAQVLSGLESGMPSIS